MLACLVAFEFVILFACLGEVSEGVRVGEVELRGVVVLNHPGEHRILRKEKNKKDSVCQKPRAI